MSDDDEGGSPALLMNQVAEDAKKELSEDPGTSKAAELVREAARELAEICVANDGDQSIATALLNDLADMHPKIQREEHARSKFRDFVDELEQKKKLEDGDKLFMQIVAESLTDVTKHLTTDKTDPSAYYSFEFNLPSETVTILLPESDVFQRKAFWSAFVAAADNKYPDRIDGDDTEWDNWMGSLIEDVGETIVKDIGPRTAALYALAGSVNTSMALGTLSDALEENEVYVDAEPPNHSETRIPRQMVAAVKQNHDVSDRMMQMEISRRGLNALDGDSVSTTKTIGRRTHVFWVVKPEFVTEFVEDTDEDDVFAGYAEEALDPIDHMDERDMGDDDDG